MTPAILLLTLPLQLAPAPGSAPADSSLAALARRIAEITPEAGGTVGLELLHVEMGARMAVNADRAFPMMSVYKLPIALAFLKRVDAGTARVDERVRVEAANLRPAYGPLAERHPEGNVTLTAAELLEWTVASDNTASDLLFELAGGPEAVTRTLRQADLEGIRVDRSEGRIAFDYHDIEAAAGATDLSRATFERLLADVPPERLSRAAARFLDDPRDRATPHAMVRLLVKLQRGELLTPESTARLINLLERVSPQEGRIKGALPAGTPVAHKSGTSGVTDGIQAVLNDVGILTLPGDAGHLAVAVFVTGSDRDPAAIEGAIARIARAAFDHWAPAPGERARGNGLSPTRHPVAATFTARRRT